MSTMFLTARSLPRAAVLTSNVSRSIFRYSSSTPFKKSPVPPNPHGEEQKIKNVALLHIRGFAKNQLVDPTVARTFSKFCKEYGVSLRHIEIIASEESKIIESSRRLIQEYDLVVAAGGTGPMEGDITYAAISKAFDLPLEQHPEVLKRMEYADIPDPKKPPIVRIGDRKKMTMIPAQSEVIFTGEGKDWMPVVRIKEKLFLIPSKIHVFNRLTWAMAPHWYLKPVEKSKDAPSEESSSED